MKVSQLFALCAVFWCFFGCSQFCLAFEWHRFEACLLTYFYECACRWAVSELRPLFPFSFLPFSWRSNYLQSTYLPILKAIPINGKQQLKTDNDGEIREGFSE